MLVELNRERLHSLGYNVVTSTSSVQALEIFKNDPHRFDLVITDYTMPHLTGIDLARALLSIRPDIPVILCSGLNEKLTHEKIKEIGIITSAPKTMDRRALAELVRRILDSKEAATP
jgi:CheY-like chemotaxis protein